MVATAESESIRVVIVDDHVLYRRGLQMVMTTEPDIEVVGEASDVAGAVQVIEATVPDVVLMDIHMPDGTGIEAARAVKSSVPSCRIVMLTMSDDADDLFEAVLAGANGYLLKDVATDQVVEAVRAVHRGHSLITPSMASSLLTEFSAMRRREEDVPTTAPIPHLTDREREVLALVARGMNNRAIGEALFISDNTVKIHVRNILEKLQLHSRVEAAAYAVSRRLIDPSA